MTTLIRDTFKQYTDIVADRHSLRRIHDYVNHFVNKNDDHIRFFGGNLMGVHPVRFKPEDRDRWFDDVLLGEEAELEQHLYGLVDPDTKEPVINQSFRVSSDVMNLSGVYLMHLLAHSQLGVKDRVEGQIQVVMALQCKFISSILTWYFKYPANEDVATATYTRLSKKFGLKIHGTWYKLLRYRAEESVKYHQKTIQGMDDGDVIKMVNDIQSRIKSIVNYIRDEFERVRSMPMALIRSKSGQQVGLDGELAVKDLQRHYSSYKRYIQTVVGDRGFIKDELVELVCGVVRTAPERQVRQVLEYMVVQSGRLGDTNVQVLLDGTVQHVFDVLGRLPVHQRRFTDVGSILHRIRGIYSSNKNTDPLLQQTKTVGEAVVRLAVRTHNNGLVVSLRLAVMLYVVARCFTMHHYMRKAA